MPDGLTVHCIYPWALQFLKLVPHVPFLLMHVSQGKYSTAHQNLHKYTVVLITINVALREGILF